MICVCILSHNTFMIMSGERDVYAYIKFNLFLNYTNRTYAQIYF